MLTQHLKGAHKQVLHSGKGDRLSLKTAIVKWETKTLEKTSLRLSPPADYGARVSDRWGVAVRMEKVAGGVPAKEEEWLSQRSNDGCHFSAYCEEGKWMGNWKDVKCAVKTGSGCGSPCRNDMQYIFGPFPRDVCVLYLNFCSIFQIAKCCNQRRMWNRHLQGFDIQGEGVMKLVIIRVT